jgi:phosphoribosylamine--glycine ligase
VSARRILVVGSGGREHALAWRLAQDPEGPEVFVAPGNEGMEDVARRLPVGENDAIGLTEACRREGVDLVVIGPEAPLAAGLADVLRAAGLAVYGPESGAARLESSKWFAKEVMGQAGIPTAVGEAFAGFDEACGALERSGPPWVVKADGLAGGKGVCVTTDHAEAEQFLRDCLVGERFGASGRRVVIEEWLEGSEASVMAVCDGRDYVLLPAARDYKRALERDRGANTGGMGAYAPHEEVNAALEEEIGRRIVGPVLEVMRRRGTPFRGTLYCGLMLTAQGPRVLEFNVRFGDPESQAVLPLVEGAFARLLASAARGQLEGKRAGRSAGAAVAVALTDEGYPDEIRGAGRITGFERLREREDVLVFHAGTRRADDGWQVTGGRAAYVVARGASRGDARARVYAALAELGGRGWRARRDIAATARPVRSGGGASSGPAGPSRAAGGSLDGGR